MPPASRRPFFSSRCRGGQLEMLPPEVRERADRLVLDAVKEYSSRCARIVALAPKFGCTAKAIRSRGKHAVAALISAVK